jgi:hypothetical protein
MTKFTVLETAFTLAILGLTGAASATLLSTPAFADHAECPGGPRDKWIGMDAAAAKAVSLGYAVRKIEIDDGCYEIKGTDKNGAKIEINIDPVTSQPVPDGARKTDAR